MPDIVGKDVSDSDGNNYMGIIQFPVPILKGNSVHISALRRKLFEPFYVDLMNYFFL